MMGILWYLKKMPIKRTGVMFFLPPQTMHFEGLITLNEPYICIVSFLHIMGNLMMTDLLGFPKKNGGALTNKTLQAGKISTRGPSAR